MDKCMICNNREEVLLKCINCYKLFCNQCLVNYYENNNTNCPSCGNVLNIDEYEPIFSSVYYSNINENYNNSDYDFEEINSQKFCFECQRIFEENGNSIHCNHHYISLSQMTSYNLNKVSADLKKFIDIKNDIKYLIQQFDNRITINKNIVQFQLEQIDKLKENIIDYFKKNNSILIEKKQYLQNIYENYENIDLILDNITKYVNQNLTESINLEIQNVNNRLDYLRIDEKEILDIKNKKLYLKPLNFKFYFHDIMFDNNNIETNTTNGLENTYYSSNGDFKDETYDLFFGKINEKEMIIKVVINKKKYKNDIFGIYFQAYNCEINRFLKIPLKCDSHDKRSISFQEIFDKNIIKDYFGEECDNIKFNLFITKLHI